jgi:hypothetical protein
MKIVVLNFDASRAKHRVRAVLRSSIVGRAAKLVACGFVLWGTLCQAQQLSISGTVSDANGVVPGASVTLRAPAGAKSETQTDPHDSLQVQIAMRGVLIRIRKFAIFCHRWMGLAFCVLFAWWFASGIFMMYWDFPSVTQADRLDRSEPIDLRMIKLSPEEAFAKLGRDGSPGGVSWPCLKGVPSIASRWAEDAVVVEAVVEAAARAKPSFTPTTARCKTNTPKSCCFESPPDGPDSRLVPPE